METDVSPLCIILVKNGSRGDRLLFRYPSTVDNKHESKDKNERPGNPYSQTAEGSGVQPTRNEKYRTNSMIDFSDKVMSNLFAVKSELCDNKFELKVNDVRFVGHPVRLNNPCTAPSHTKKKTSTIVLFNIVFALKAHLNHDIVSCYHDLSMRLGLALRHEEYRCNFLSTQAKIMLQAHDEVGQLPEDQQVSPFSLILERSQFARTLKNTYDHLCATGIVHVRLNKWINVSFCLPHKVHHSLVMERSIDYEVLLRGLQKLKPYHTMLLLVDCSDLLRSLSADASPALRRILHVQSPLKPFYTLAADADLTLPQVFMLVGHLVYWGKATIIYPVCSTNVYVLSPHCSSGVNTAIEEAFSEAFPGCRLHNALQEYSMPSSLSDKFHPMNDPQQQQQQVQQLLFLLKLRLLQQLHTYVFLAPPPNSAISTYNSRLGGRTDLGLSSHSGTHGTSSPGSTAIPTPTVQEASTQQIPATSSAADSTQSIDPTHEALHNAVAQLSQPASESDLGSVCSDERSPSPGLGLLPTAATEDSTSRLLDTYLTPAEKEQVLRLDPIHHTPDDLKLFAELCPYFRGEHHLEEMMYQANLRRSQLLQIIDKFRQILITCQHPDDSLSLIRSK
ncbi:unnamed protein product [Meganyctiphanes norvegica]|uniref:GATOR complex protein NPRL3 n=1 Tax=Meganyctiphanes norvegica TaxID=48144 RepID=A0AAV2RM97_MEGNR